jgi:tetratricopeptide (TPR) repeat protein
MTSSPPRGTASPRPDHVTPQHVPTRLALLLCLACGLAVPGTVRADEGAGEHRTRAAALIRTAETDPRQAIAMGPEALALARRHADPGAEADAYRGLAAAQHTLGRLDAAAEAAQAARDAAHRAHDPAGRVFADALWALIAMDRGDIAGALETLIAAARVAETAGPHAQGVALAALGQVQARLGDHAQAMAHLRRARVLLEQAGASARTISDVDTAQGLAAFTAGAIAEAVEAQGRAIARGQRTGNRHGEAEARLRLGDVYASQGRLAEAQRQYADGAEAAAATGEAVILTRLLFAQGQLAQRVGDTAATRRLLEEALDRATAAGARADVAAISYALFDVATATGEVPRALEFLRQHSAAYAASFGPGTIRRITEAQHVDGALRAAADRQAFDAHVARAEVVRTSLLGVSLTALVLAAVLGVIGHLRMRRDAAALAQLRRALADTARLEDLLLICATCKRIKDEARDWTTVEEYLGAHVGAEFTHGICPGCEQRLLASAEQDADLIAALGVGEAEPVPPMHGGFDWPPSTEELARAGVMAERPRDWS